MNKNNPLRKYTPENRNYKLYKAKKQWITACATVLMALGATAATQVNAQAANNTNNNAAPTAEVKITGTTGNGSGSDNTNTGQSAASAATSATPNGISAASSANSSQTSGHSTAASSASSSAAQTSEQSQSKTSNASSIQSAAKAEKSSSSAANNTASKANSVASSANSSQTSGHSIAASSASSSAAQTSEQSQSKTSSASSIQSAAKAEKSSSSAANNTASKANSVASSANSSQASDHSAASSASSSAAQTSENSQAKVSSASSSQSAAKAEKSSSSAANNTASKANSVASSANSSQTSGHSIAASSAVQTISAKLSGKSSSIDPKQIADNLVQKTNVTVDLSSIFVERTYNGADFAFDNSVDFSGITATDEDGNSVDITVPDNLTVDDFTWYNAAVNDEQLESHDGRPYNVGIYYGLLSASGLAKFNEVNSNYNFTNPTGDDLANDLANGTGVAQVQIDQALAKLVLSGTGSRAYNGQKVTLNDINNSSITATLYYPKDGDSSYHEKIKLQNWMIRWAASNDSTTKAPTMPGATYYLAWNRDTNTQKTLRLLLKKLAGSGNDPLGYNVENNVKVDYNKSWIPYGTDKSITFTITPDSATLSGSGSSTYTGQAITLDDLNKSGVAVNVDGPKDAAGNSTYTLKQGDVEFSSDNGATWSTTMPNDVGTYQIRLTTTGVNNIKAAFNKVAGGQDAIWTDSNENSTIGGKATYDINPSATVSFVDDDTKDDQGNPTQVGTTTISGKVGDKTTITLPKALSDYQLADGQSLDYTFTSANNQAVTIHLVHQIVDDTDVNDTQENRTLTVNYVNGKTGQAMDGLTPAQLQVHYKRTAKKDAVTGKMVSHGDWLWDSDYSDDGFTKGYKVLSGTWGTLDNSNNFVDGLPTDWNNLVVKVPAVTGYTSFTSGDWETVNGNTPSNTPANQFVFPTWNNYGTDGKTLNGKESLAYTNKATVYEATATHTVYFVPDTADPAARKITAQFTKLKQNADGTWSTDGQVAPDATMNVYFNQHATAFKTNGSTDHTKWTIIYGDNGWQFDSNTGDADTPGFNNITGNWNKSTLGSKGHPTTGSIQVVVPDAPTGYVKVDSPAGYDLSYFANPMTPPASSIFTGNTDSTLYMRNKLVFYYVPDSAVNKTVTRTINIANNPTLGRSQTITQSTNFSRSVRINANDDGVEFGVMNGTTFQAGNDIWKNDQNVINGKGNWDEYDLTIPGYTAIINNKAVTEVAANNGVTADTKDATVNVSYIKNAAKITISGPEIDRIYTGSGFTVTADMAKEISNAVAAADSHLTLPTGSSSVKLDQSDFSFVDNDGNAMTTEPTNAGTYRIILNSTGLKKFQDLDANFTWNYDPSKSYVVFKINKATPTVKFSATGSKTYDGSEVLNNSTFTGAPTISYGTQTGGTNVSFQSGDFEFVAADGTVIPASISLTSGVVSGPTNVGTYKIQLTAQGLQRIKDANPNFDLSKVTIASVGTGTYTIDKYTPAIAISGSGQKTYDGQAVTSADVIKQDTDNTITITMTIPKEDGSGNETIKYEYNYNPNADYVDDYTWSDNGKTLTAAPKNAGTYTIILKSSGVQSILNDMLQNDPNFKYLQGNVDVSQTTTSGSATYTIKQKPLTVWINGKGGKVYDANNATMPTDLYKHLQTTGLVSGEALNTDTFDAADYQWYEKESDGTYKAISSPTNVGTYYIGILPATDTHSGIQTLQRDNPNYDLTVNTSKYYTYTITPGAGTITLQGNQTDTYSGAAHTVSGYKLAIAGPGVTSADDEGKLENGDLEFSKDGTTWTTSVPVDAGTYYVRLAQSAKDFLTKTFPNLTLSYSGTFSDYVINPSRVTVAFKGDSNKTYDGSPISITYSNANFQSHFTVSGLVPGYTLQYQDAEPDLFEWTDDQGNVLSTAPTTAGTYYLKLKDLDAVNKLNPNYTFSFAENGNGWKWTIDKATATINFANNSGSQTTAWTGKPTVLEPNNFAVKITTNNGQTLTADTLTANDFDFYQNGQKISTPTEVGAYTVKLNASGLKKIEKDTDNYTWTDNAVGNYYITQAQATINLNGSASTTYNGKEAVIPTNSDGSVKGITVTLSNGQIYTLKAGDLQFVDEDGTPVQTPVNAGTYYVSLTTDALSKISNLDGTHYDYVLGDAKTAKFIINKANATIALSGTGSSTYDGNAVDSPNGNYTIQLPGQSSDSSVSAGDLVFVEGKPTNAGTYDVALSSAYQKSLHNQYDKNYNLTFTSTGTYTINPKVVDLILNGTASQVYNGQPAKITDASGITLTYGDHTTKTAPIGVTFTLTPDDLVVKDKNGKVPTDANDYDQDSNPYYISDARRSGG